jgi:hypothetical protein
MIVNLEYKKKSLTLIVKPCAKVRKIMISCIVISDFFDMIMC